MTQNPLPDNQKVIVEIFLVGPLQCNCTILGDPQSGQAIIIDPGGDHQLILEKLNTLGLTTVKQILHTHAHFDHFLASGEMKKATGAPLALHQEDKPLWDNLEMQCGLYNIPYSPVPSPDHWIQHEEEIELPNCCGTALHTPGHTPGSMSFAFPQEKLLVAGDTLFKGSIGRTDLWGGDHQAIERSIRERLYTLDEEMKVVTGHGPLTTVGDEMRNNAFVRA